MTEIHEEQPAAHYSEIIEILHRKGNLEYAEGLSPTKGWKKLDMGIENLLRSLPTPPANVNLIQGNIVLFSFEHLSRKMDLPPTYLSVRLAG
jgi:hypothetical protein